MKLMANDYRINLRFRLDNSEEKQAADYLRSLGKSRNQYIVEAVTAYIRNKNPADSLSLGNIRQMFREELQAISIAVPQDKPKGLTEAEQEQNMKNILDDLDMFD